MTPAVIAISSELSETMAANDGAEASRVAQSHRAALLALPPGIHEGVPNDVYHARVINFVSKSALDRIAKAPAIHKAWADGLGKKETPALRFGTALHMRLLEPDRFRRTYVMAPHFGSLRKNDSDGTTTEQGRENKKRRDEWMAEHKGAVILAAGDGDATLGMINSIAEHRLARMLLEKGTPELTVKWTCPASGLPAKVRADSARPQIAVLADIKTCEDASPDGFKRSLSRYGLHRQDALYRAIFGEAGVTIARFVFIAVEKTPPYLVMLHECTDDALREGHASWQRDAATLARCVESGVWPGYPEVINKIDLMPWAREDY